MSEKYMPKLRQYLYRIGEAIRFKEGSSDIINAATFPERIRDLALSLPGETGQYHTEIGTDANGYIRPVKAYIWGKSVHSELASNGLLHYVEWLPGVTGEISVSACSNCSSLVEAIVPEGVTSIRGKAFYYCENLNEIHLPDTLTYIGQQCFYACKKLSNIVNARGEHVLPSGIETIPEECFRSAVLSNLRLNEGLKSIDVNAFRGATMQTGNLPESVESIGNYAFGAAKLNITKLPANLKTIGTQAFNTAQGVNITRIPASVTSIGASAFGSLTGLTEITFEGTPSSINSSAFSSCTSVTKVNVPWAEGAVANAPWGMTNATINYNYVEGEV